MRSVEALQHQAIVHQRRRRGAAKVPARARAGVKKTLMGAVMVVALWLLGVWLVTWGDGGDRSLFAGSPDQLGYIEVTVASGDTLWSLARQYGPAKRDIRETVDRIRTINGLHDRASLRPGERLTIPTH